jgi:hypothetical protein
LLFQPQRLIDDSPLHRAQYLCRTGVDKVIETTGSRTRLNIIRAIRLGFLSEAIPHQYKTVNGESIIDFFEWL